MLHNKMTIVPPLRWVVHLVVYSIPTERRAPTLVLKKMWAPCAGNEVQGGQTQKYGWSGQIPRLVFLNKNRVSYNFTICMRGGNCNVAAVLLIPVTIMKVERGMPAKVLTFFYLMAYHLC